MGDYKYVIYEKEGNIARVILNKPEKLNAFDFMRREDAWEIEAALNEAAKDDDVKVVIMKGNGRAFCVGEDLNKVGFVYGIGTKSEDRRASQRIRLRLDIDGFRNEWLRVLIHPKITIAQVHGYALGGGVYYTAACDFAIAAEDAQLGITEQRLGFSGSGAPHVVLIMTMGLRRALDLMITGRMISGKEAEQMRLVTKAVPADKLEEETEKLAKAITLLPRDGIAIGKATRHLLYYKMGIVQGHTPSYISHTMFTNMRWEPDEYNFFKQRKEKGTKAGFHERDARFTGLV
jgi:enoyl-CoA hydratase